MQLAERHRTRLPGFGGKGLGLGMAALCLAVCVTSQALQASESPSEALSADAAALRAAGIQDGHGLGKALADRDRDELLPPATLTAVAQELQKGYLLHDRLLRPAMVMIAKAPVAADPTEDQTDQAEKKA